MPECSPTNQGVVMDQSWVMLAFIWAVVEFIQFLRKRPLPQRMKTGAIWGTIFATIYDIGAHIPGGVSQANFWSSAGIYLAMTAFVALFIYWLRLLLAWGWNRISSKPTPESRIS